MFLDPSSITLGQLSSAARDWAIVGFLFGTAIALTKIAWKSRGIYEDVSGFVTRISDFMEASTLHMTRMETFATRVLNNHLAHMQHDLRTLSGRTADVIEVHDSIGTDTDQVSESLDSIRKE